MVDQLLNDTTNYLVPASGKTHSVTFSGVYNAIPFPIDWRQFSIDNYKFNPQGVFIDNTLGIAAVIITILPINYRVSCPAGVEAQFQFPAPDNQTCTITGNGQASVVFVDFPVLPNAGLINVGNTVNAAIVNAIAVPFVSNIITGAVVTASIAPAANTNLKKLVLSLSANAT